MQHGRHGGLRWRVGGVPTPHPPSPPPTIEDLEAECAAEGLEGRYADLIYNVAFERPIWAVSNVLSSEGAAQAGESLAIDAATGEILQRSQWEQMP